jgi:hypothetical protein
VDANGCLQLLFGTAIAGLTAVVAAIVLLA